MRRLTLAFLIPTVAAGILYLALAQFLVAPRTVHAAANLSETTALVARTLENLPLDRVSKTLRSSTNLSSLRAILVDGRGRVRADSDVGLSEPVPGLFTALAHEALAGGSAHRVVHAEGGREFLAAARPISSPAGPRSVLILVRRVPLPSWLSLESALAILLALLAAALPAWLLARWVYRGWVDPLARITVAMAQAEPGNPLLGLADLGTSQTHLLRVNLQRLLAEGHSRLTAAMRESDRLRKVLDDLPEGVLLVDAEGRPRVANHMFRKLFQSRAKVSEASLLELTRHPAIARLVRQVLASGEAQQAEIALQIPKVVDLNVECQPTGSGDGAILVAHDTSAERRLNAMRRDFVANVSHELKTPLAALRGYLELLAEGALEDPAKGRHFLDRMLHQTQRLEALVGDLLTLARLESAASILNETFDLEAVAKEALESVRPFADGRGVRLRCEAHGPVPFAGDRKAIEHLISNLLMNAVQYSPADSEVDLRLQATPEEAVLEVEDHGIGISASDQERIFERFYRVDPARSRQVGGTGLGLAIVKHATQLHGGVVEVESELEHGSTFTVRLPRRPLGSQIMDAES